MYDTTVPRHAAPYPPASGPIGWLRRAEAWLDARGRWAWIAAMVAGFILFWPVGLALLAYMIWSKEMFSRTFCGSRRDRGAFCDLDSRAPFRSSGNATFDAYKAETLRRLQDEQQAFEAFLDRLRAAKDKKEFDAFMDERARNATAPFDASAAGPVTVPGGDIRRADDSAPRATGD